MMSSEITKAQARIDGLWAGFLAVMMSLGATMLPLEVVAQLPPGANVTGTSGAGTSLDNALCNVLSWFNGPIGKGIASLALIIVGIGALMGKVSWGMAIIVGIGVAIVFGATEIVSAIGGGGDQGCANTVMSGNTV